MRKCWHEKDGVIIINNTKGETYETNREELADLGKRYNYRDIADEFGLGPVVAWEMYRDLGIRKKYVRHRKVMSC